MPEKSNQIGIVTGGSGSSKLVSALEAGSREKSKELVYIANVADNFWRFGLYICPDVDIITYSLASLLSARGWGIENDSRNFLSMYSRLTGQSEWFTLGDGDLAVSIFRTQLLKSGLRLHEITERICRALGIQSKIIPSTDDYIETIIGTEDSKMHLQDFWVRLRGEPEVKSVEYLGLDAALPNEAALDALSGSVLVLPANPVSSVMPTISLRGAEQKLKNAKVIAVSPFVGDQIFSGPAPKFMRAAGVEASSYGVASLYSSFLKIFVVDKSESHGSIDRIKDLGTEVVATDIRIRTDSASSSLVTEILNLI